MKRELSIEARTEFIKKQNIFIEAIYKAHWPRSMKDVALVIYRKTLGWNKMSDCISRKQIADELGLERDLNIRNSENKNERNITKRLKQLEGMRVILIEKRAMTTKGGYLDKYTLLDPAGWLPYEYERGVNSNASNSGPKPEKGRKSATERGVNAGTKEALGRTPNKLNTNELQRKDLGEQENAIPSGLSGPFDSIRDHIIEDLRFTIGPDNLDLDTIADTLVKRGYSDIGSKLDELWETDSLETTEKLLEQFPDLTECRPASEDYSEF